MIFSTKCLRGCTISNDIVQFPQILRDIVNEMVDYAFYHFNTEEKYLLEFDFPETKNHITEHNKYRSKMKDLLSRIEVITEDEINALFGEISVFAIE